MKNFFILLIAASVFLPSCKKSDKATTITYANTAIINGPLNGYLGGAACWGKYWITINDSTAYPTFNTLPSGSGIDPDSATFAAPIHVKLNWHNATGCNSVVIDAIEKAD